MEDAVRSFGQIVIVLSLLIPTTASAQFGTTPTDGLRLPETSITTREDATALELNPAGLAFIQRWDASVVYTTAHDDALAGTGVFVGGRLFGQLGLGGAVQWVENPALGGDFKKFTLGLGSHIGERLSFGLSYSFFDHDTSTAVDTFSSFDAGIQLRLTNWMGFGASFRDFNTPRLGGVALEPRYVAGVAFRTNDGRYGVEVEAIRQSTEDLWFLRARGSLEPLRGLQVFVESQTEDLSGFAIQSLQAGLAFSFGPSVVSSAAAVDFSGGTEFAGTSTGLRVSGRPHRSLYEPSGMLAGLTLSGSLPERGGSSFLLGRQRSFLDLLNYFDGLRRDEHISGLVLTLENPSYGLAQHWEIRQALMRLREAGKEVVIFMRSADFGDLYLASVADRVYVAPGITFFPRGMSTTMTYLGGLFENIGIEAEFVRIAEYKSAPEQFMEREPSEYALEAVNAFYDDSFGHMVSAIATGRDLPEADVRAMIDNSPLSPVAAVEQGFADGVCFRDELDDRMAEDYGVRRVVAERYNLDWQRSYDWTPAPAIAVIYVDGSIMEGTSGSMPLVGDVAGHRSVITSLNKAVATPTIRGIILRVDSPGGSAWASEQMWRAIQQANESVPVVISMGDIAASGGYYVAAGGTEILATDLTVTGSIGIFSGHFSAEGLLDTIGVNRFPIRRGVSSNLFGIDGPWSEAERNAAERDIQLMYDTFLLRVADNRGLTPDEIDPIARGRVWSGTRAEGNGLVDQLGGLLDAADRIRDLSDLDPDQEVRFIAMPARSTVSMILDSVGLQETLTGEEMGALAILAEALGLDHVLQFPILFGDGRPAARMMFELDGLE